MKFLYGNWKMAQDLAGLEKFFSEWNLNSPKVEIGIFPSAPYLEATRLKSKALSIVIGAQDCSTEESGAFTGEVSAKSLRELGGERCLVGHSECRERGGETAESLRQKLDRVIEAGMIPVFCLGEKESERVSGKTKGVIESQLKVIDGIGDRVLVAYEPVWAIGTGRTPSLKDVEEAHSQIWAAHPKIRGLLYGGSVKPENARDLSSVSGVSGFLVGGASLKARDFQKIAESML